MEEERINMKKRKPNRLKDFDYSSNEAYFVTIRVNERKPLFGEIVNENCILNVGGKMI